MTNQELATCAIEGIPIKVAIINNGNLGMVRQWQTLFYDERYSNTDLGTAQAPDPRLREARRGATAASACAASTTRTSTRTIEKAMAIDDAPVVVDFIVGTGRAGVADGRRRHEQRRDPWSPAGIAPAVGTEAEELR